MDDGASDKDYERRKARAERQAALDEGLPRLPRRIRKALRRGGARRSKVIERLARNVQTQRVLADGRHLHGPRANKQGRLDRQARMDNGLKAFLSDRPRVNAGATWTAENLRDELLKPDVARRYFPDGIPYKGKAGLLKAVSRTLTRLRPKHRRDL